MARVMKVSNQSNVNSTGSRIAHLFRDHPTDIVEVRALGAGAVNQAVKAIAVARGQMASRAYDLVVRVGFDEVTGKDDVDLSVVVLRIEAR